MIIYALIGISSGIVSGLGIGGGTILIPLLVIFFGVSQQSAQSINLIYFIPTASIALIVHFKNGNIEKKAVLRLILFGVIAALASSMIAVHISADLLKRVFGVFLLVMGVMEFFKKRSR